MLPLDGKGPTFIVPLVADPAIMNPLGDTPVQLSAYEAVQFRDITFDDVDAVPRNTIAGNTPRVTDLVVTTPAALEQLRVYVVVR